MNLRTRLFVVTLAITLVLEGVILLGYRSIMRHHRTTLFTSLATAHLKTLSADACLRTRPAPTFTLMLRLGGPLRRHPTPIEIKLFLYDHRGQSRNPSAPVLPISLQKSIRHDHTPVPMTNLHSPQVLYFRVKLNHQSCAIAMAAIPNLSPSLPPPPYLLAPILLSLLLVLFSGAPLVRRIQVQIEAVRMWENDENHKLPNDSRRDELGELSRALSKASETIKQQHIHLKDRETTLREFVENTTHDLSTPLTVLRGNLSALVNEYNPELVQQAMNETEYLSALLDNLSLSAKMEAQSHTETILDLREIVLRVVLRHRPMAKRLSVSIERSVPDSPVYIKADPTCTEQALTNLVNNAVKHNLRHGHVAVVLEQNGEGCARGTFCLTVLDDGPGLTQEEFRCALTRGERGDQARSRNTSGRGLGLSIVSRVAKLHGWEFSLQPNHPSGLLATLRCPTSQAP